MYVENVPYLVKQLIHQAIVAGKQEKSINFSKYDGKHVFVVGTDGGGGDLVMMTDMPMGKMGIQESTASLLVLQKE
jgi:hypothetical protein